MTNNIIQQITNIENLHWAWQKARNAYKPSEMWFNEIEVLKFEANLTDELNKIQKDIENDSYEISPIRPIAFPKAKNNDGPRTRQTFYISVRDQVTWLAVTNIIGPTLDYQMPFWSYGNRLFISVFYKLNDNEKPEIKFGRYRHTSKHIYKKWTQSWPLYRRHIAITARIMSKQTEFQEGIETFKEELSDDKEIEILEQNEKLPPQLKIAYLQKDYWNKKLSGDLYWASIDLKKFYPNIKLSEVKSNYSKYYPKEFRSKELDSLLSKLLCFPLDAKGWNNDELNNIDINLDNNQRIPSHFEGIPTGLFVAGFIANLAMLDIDQNIDRKIKDKRNIAHFKFVDDHVILSDNFEEIVNWIDNYKTLLNNSNTGACINIEKTEPESLKTVIDSGCNISEKEKEKAKRESKLDPDFPSPLMTQTLAKISLIAHTNFDLLDSNEENNFISDLEHLLVTEFPDQELRRDTRISFAASTLSRLAPRRTLNIDELYEKHKEIIEQGKELERLKEQTKLKAKTYQQEIFTQINTLKDNIKNLESEQNDIEKKLYKNEERSRRHIYNLLLKAIKENHEKIKIWTRSIEYCRRTGENELYRIIELLEKLSKDNITTRLSKEYIHAIILMVMVEQMILAYHTVASGNSSYVQVERAKTFLSGILNYRFLKKIIEREKLKEVNKFYFIDSIDLFRFALGSIITLLRSEVGSGFDNNKTKIKINSLVNKFDLMDWNDPTRFFDKTQSQYSLGDWSWWLIHKTTKKLSNEPNIIYKLWLFVEVSG